MAYDIIIGRSKQDKQRFGLDGTILLGKHYVQMGQTVALSNKIFLDMIRSHVVFVAGKRGSGKSYSLGVIAEGMADLPEAIRKNMSIILLDTMGIYWTMTGLHGLHVLGGVIAIAWFLVPGMTLFRKDPEMYTNRIEYVGLYWHFVDLVWIFLFPIIYLL